MPWTQLYWGYCVFSVVEHVCSYVVGLKHLCTFPLCFLLGHISGFACSFISTHTHPHSLPHWICRSSFFLSLCCLEIKISWFCNLHCVLMIKWFWVLHHGKIDFGIVTLPVINLLDMQQFLLFLSNLAVRNWHCPYHLYCVSVCVCFCVNLGRCWQRCAVNLAGLVAPLTATWHCPWRTDTNAQGGSHLSPSYVWDAALRCHCFFFLLT